MIQQKDFPFRKCYEACVNRLIETYTLLGACNTNLLHGTVYACVGITTVSEYLAC